MVFVRAGLAITLLAGCFAPSPATGVECGAGGACPDPLVCAPATNTCERTRGDTTIDAAIDAPVDAGVSPGCAPLTTHDEDGDGVVDNCDNCPGIANADQKDSTESAPDGVGDACDPRPSAADRITLFEAFAAAPSGWSFDPMTTFSNDRLVTAAAQGYAEAYSPKVSTDGALETRWTITALATDPPYSSVEVVAEKTNAGVEGYRCQSGQGGPASGRGLGIQTFVEPYDVAGGTVGIARFAVGNSGVLRFAYGGTLVCNSTSPVDTVTVAEPEARMGNVGVATQYVGAAFDYLVLYEPAP